MRLSRFLSLMIVAMTPTLLFAAGKGPCVDSIWFGITIVQKLGPHSYEVAGDGVTLPNGILETKKAVFNSTGHPLGIKIMYTEEVRKLPLKNGFEGSYFIYRECGIVPLTKGRFYPPDYTAREFLKGE